MDGITEHERQESDKQNLNGKQKKVGKKVKKMVKPLLDINCQYDRGCEYPTVLRIAMDDGTVRNYVLENEIGLQLEKLNNSLDKFHKMTVGYRYKQRKRRIHWGKQ